VSADPPCYVAEDSDLSYPDCCPQAVCPGEEDDDVIFVEPEEIHQEPADNTTESTSKGREGQVVDKETQVPAAEQDRDSENEVEDTVEVNAEEPHDEYYYVTGHVSQDAHAMGNPFLYPSYHHDDEDDSENIIDTNDLGMFGDSHFQQQSPEDLSYNSEFRGRKVSPRFYYMDSMYPKFGHHWTF